MTAVHGGSQGDTASGLVAAYVRAASTDPGALRALEATLQRAGASAELWRDVANGLLADGALAAAGTLLHSALRMHPGDPGLRCRLADALRAQGRYAESEHELRAALADHPRDPALAKSLAFLLREQGRCRAALEAVSAHWPDGRLAEDAGTKATFLAQCNQPAAALQVCRRALAKHEDARLLQLSGQLAATVGEFDQATADLRRAVQLDPGQASAWLWLALVHPFRSRTDPDLRALESAREHAPTGSEVRIATGFALGKAWDDLDDIPAAVRELRAANDAVAAREAWNPRQWAAFVDAQVSKQPPARVPDEEAVTPVFVVGMPRTGTTLVAALLSRHPEVRNRGEMGWLASIAAQVAAHGHAEDFMRRAARLYAAQLRQDDEPARFHVDKNPSNAWHLGLAAALFPDARVILCRRNPRDTALSIWRQRFAGQAAGFAYRFEDIARVMDGHARLMDHWRAVLRVPVLEVRYEDLVAGPDAAIANALRFLGVDDPMRTREGSPVLPVGTASVWQARQPVHAQSVGRWRRYFRWLPELAAIPED